MKQLVRKLTLKLHNWTKTLAKPHQDELVLALVLQTAALELPKGEYRELAPVKGCCGPFKLSGNSLPVFEYKVFEKSIMEFIHVRVEVSRPDRIYYRATIDSTTAPERHGEEVEMKAKYKEPFERLSWHLFQYFPFYRQK